MQSVPELVNPGEKEISRGLRDFPGIRISVSVVSEPTEKVLAFPEMGMEAIYEFEVRDMPVSVAVDARGTSVHEVAPKIWKEKKNIIWMQRLNQMNMNR